MVGRAEKTFISAAVDPGVLKSGPCRQYFKFDVGVS